MAENATVKLYDSAGNTLASHTLDELKCIKSTGAMYLLFNPLPEVRLYEGQKYRLGLRSLATGASQSHTIPNVAYASAAEREACFGPGYLSTRANAGAWTEVQASQGPLIPVMQQVYGNKFRFK